MPPIRRKPAKEGDAAFGRANRLLFVRTENHCVSVFTPAPNAKEGAPAGAVLLLLQGIKNHKSYTMSLSDFTTEELEVIRQTLILALDLAAPISSENDRLTEEGILADGNPGLKFYRHAPTVVYGKGALERHDPSVYRGHSELLSRAGANVDPAGGVPGRGSEVADLEENDTGADDDAPSAGVDPGAGEVSGMW